ncbi:hypothetical protein KAW80_04405 [Candidatus Babeliales bacterium]|nr:hypothetical protein [Candidatus Babeliales bacterium]
MIDKKKLTLLIIAIATVVLSKLLKLFTVSYSCGSQSMIFSGVSIIGPFYGFLLSIPAIFVYSLMIPLTCLLIKGSLGFSIFSTFGIPTAGAALSLRAASQVNRKFGVVVLDIVMRIVVPVICMTLFLMHPIGYSSFPYSFYWFVPIVFFILNYNKVMHSKFGIRFSAALSSTFIAHALGSVIYLYSFDTSALLWLSLIPIVAFERLVIAGGMVGLYYLLEGIALIYLKRHRGIRHL